MGRNSTGTAARVVDPYTPGQSITAQNTNAELNDIYTELTDSLSRNGKGGMNASLKLLNGTVGTPAFHFASGTTTGMYLNAAGDLRIALTAADIARFTAALVRIETALLVNGNVECNALDASGNADVGGTLAVTGNTTLGGTLAVTGAITGPSLDVSGEAECGTLDCLGNGVVGGTLGVTGATTLSGNTTVGGTLGVTLTLTCTNGIDVTNDKIVNLADGTISSDAANYGQLLAVAARLGSVIAFTYADEAAQGQTYYLSPGADASAEDMYWIAPVAGVVDKLFVYHDTASATCSATYTVRKNAADQAVTCTVASTQQSGSDTSNSFSVAAGDRITIKVVVGAGVVGPLDLSTALRFTPS